MSDKSSSELIIDYVKEKLKKENVLNAEQMIADITSVINASKTKYTKFLNEDINITKLLEEKANKEKISKYKRALAVSRNLLTTEMIRELIPVNLKIDWRDIVVNAISSNDDAMCVRLEIVALILIVQAVIKDEYKFDDAVDYFILNNKVYAGTPYDEKQLELVNKYTNYIFINTRDEVTANEIDTNRALDIGIERLLDRLEGYSLTDEAKKVVTEFYTFKFNQIMNPGDYLEIFDTYYNLLLCTNAQNVGIEVVKIILDCLGIQKNAIVQNRQSRMIEQFFREDGFEYDENTYVIITDCQEIPVINVDEGNSSTYAEDLRRLKRHNIFWKELADYAKKNPTVCFLIVCNNEVYRNTIKRNNEINYRIFGHRIFLNDVDSSVVLNKCIMRFENCSIPLEKDFIPAFTDYFNAIYSTADLKGVEFIEDVIVRVNSRYFRKKQTGKGLTKDCIPKYEKGLRTEDDFLGELNSLIGLSNVKETFTKLIKEQFIFNKTNKKKVKKNKNYHMLFMGNPGTGKTMAARMVADILFASGVIKTPKLVDAKPSDFISMYENASGEKTKKKIQEAYDGVLFIDEAYGLCTGTSAANDVLAEIIKAMSDNNDRIVFIFAGYESELEKLEKINKGFSSRIGYRLRFNDYTLEELKQIFYIKCEKEDFEISDDANAALEECLQSKMASSHFANGRDVDTLFEQVKESWSSEYYDLLRKNENVTINREFTRKNFEDLIPPKENLNIEQLIGLKSVKEKLNDFKKQVAYQHYLEERGMVNQEDQYMHMLFVGNPGTGKTTVAKMIANDLYSVGILKNNRMTVVTQRDILTGYWNDITDRVTECVNKAKGGVLFIDEAYFIAELDDHNNKLGQLILDTLLPLMEERRKDTIIIFAGYENKMQNVFDMNPGLQSRIGFTFCFEDYNADELTKIYKNKMDSLGFVVNNAALKKVNKLMDYYSEQDDFGNGRFVDRVIANTKNKRANRPFDKKFNDITAKDIPEIDEMNKIDVFGKTLYDPKKIVKSDKKRIAIHELGHAIVAYHLDRSTTFESISIQNKAKSLGRVVIERKQGNLTEEQLVNFVKTCLAGRCAERVLLGQCSTGCASDIAKAKKIIKDMNTVYALFEPMRDVEAKMLSKYDKEVMDLLKNYEEIINEIADELVNGKEYSNDEFKAKLKKYMK